MIHNLPVKTLRHNELTIEGYSRAAVQTYWRIPELKLGFDLGAHPWSFMGTGTWFVSHGHLDHIAALPLYVARRRMMKMEPPTIYMPESTIDPVRQILRQFTRLDRGRMPCNLVGVHRVRRSSYRVRPLSPSLRLAIAFLRRATSSGNGGGSSSQNLSV
jgi:ribonuclease Z